jgi:hypothetical protein
MPMIKKLLILAFIIAVAANALAARSPHIDGDGGCSLSCCQAARETSNELSLSGLCCVMDCKQPAGTNATSPANSIASTRFAYGFATHLAFRTEAATQTRSIKLSHLPARKLAGSYPLYIEIGSLLI